MLSHWMWFPWLGSRGIIEAARCSTAALRSHEAARCGTAALRSHSFRGKLARGEVFTLLDVRETDEWEAGHVSPARWNPADT